MGSERPREELAQEVLREALVWHFSGTGETAPWTFMDLPHAQEVFDQARQIFETRDPGCVVATALREWRSALDDLLQADEAEVLRVPLQEAVLRLKSLAEKERWKGWRCDGCFWRSRYVRELKDVPSGGKYCSDAWRDVWWLCGECVVQRLRAASTECACSADWSAHAGAHWDCSCNDQASCCDWYAAGWSEDASWKATSNDV